jgi:DNA replication protein DnaC
MTSPPAIPGPNYDADMDAEWHADRLAHRIRLLRDGRPRRLRHSGDLDPRISEWGNALNAGTAGNLIIIGPVGTGKSWSAWEVLDRAVTAGYPGQVRYLTVAKWQDAIAPPVDREELRAMRTADVLVLDDLGSFRINDWERECLLTVVDERWMNDLPVIVTSNMANAEQELGPRLASRLADRATVVALNGPDRRAAQ